jgi:putative thioredoxin
MKSDYIIDVSESDFEFEVLGYSSQAPVIVDFWAEWCGPCRTLSPILEGLTEEAGGSFRLAKVDVDSNPNLARRFGVHGIPAVKAFRDGQIIAEFTGIQPEPQIREFLKKIIPGEADLLLEKANSLLLAGNPSGAEISFRQALQLDPDHQAAVLGLAKSELLQGKALDARFDLNTIHGNREYSSVQSLTPLVDVLVNIEENGSGVYVENDDALDLAFVNSLHLITRGNLYAALDGLLDILRQDKRYRNGLAHKIILAILELLGENDPEIRQYRTELASILF